MPLTLLFLFSVCAGLKNAISQQRDRPSSELPILAWYGIPPQETSLVRYEELKRSGITCNFTTFPDIHAMDKALAVARQTGLKMLVSCPELKTDTRATVEHFMRNPAVAGYFLQDEPSLNDFSRLAQLVKQIRAIDDSHFCYINLFPNYADEKQLGVKDYADYVHKFIQQVPVQQLSFDHYPVKETTLEKGWYENLEIISADAKKVQKPFWAFALAVTFNTHHMTTVAELRLQLYSNLAYGAQGIQYFTYWTPPGGELDFHDAPLTADGKRSEVYDRIRLVNTEIKRLSWIFLGDSVITVAHTGETIPRGTMRLTKLPAPVKVLETTGSGAVVSELKNGENHFLLIVNRDFIHPMKLTLFCDQGVNRVLKDGSLVPAARYKNTMEVEPGDAVIYQWPEQ